MNVSLLLGYQLIEGSVPKIFDAVNRNSLAVFLVVSFFLGGGGDCLSWS